MTDGSFRRYAQKDSIYSFQYSVFRILSQWGANQMLNLS